MSITTYLLIFGFLGSSVAQPEVWTSVHPPKTPMNDITFNETREHCDVCVNEAEYCDSTWLPALNLNRALTGIDIAKKKFPMPFKPEEDPSVKEIIFNSVFRNEVLGNMEPYGYIHLTDKLTCTSEFESKAWKSMEEYISGSASSSMSSWSQGYEGPTISGGFHFGGIVDVDVSMPPNTISHEEGDAESSESMEQFFSSEKGSISHSEARCSVYSVIIDIDDPSLSLHSSFVEGIRNIDLAKTENEKKSVMERFINKFGSHFADKSTMGVGVLFETRYTEEETMNHNDQTRNDCSSESGGSRICGFSLGGSHAKCKGSMNDTTQGNDTSVKRFSVTSYGTLPHAGSLEEWGEMVNGMMIHKTLSPLPIQQSLRLIIDLFATPAVANIVHEDGSKVNITNLVTTALDGYGRYCSHAGCKVSACANTVLVKGIEINDKVFTLKKGFELNGSPTYMNSERQTLYLGDNKDWILSQDLSEIPFYKSSQCPQKEVEFQEIEYAIGNGPLPGEIATWKVCAQKCFDLHNCKFWQHNIDTKKCSLIADYNYALTTSSDVATGSRDCPGEKSQFAFGLCVENMPSRSMWMSEGSSIFEKDVVVEPFDPTTLIIAAGYDGNNLNDVEIFFSEDKNCNVDDLPDVNRAGNLLVTAGHRQLLYCGGYPDGSGSGYSDQCYALEATHWISHSRLKAYRWYSSSITMPAGAYILGGNGHGETSDFLAASTDTWQTGPRLPHNFRGGCAVQINEEEFVIIGGFDSRKKVSSYNTVTETWTPHRDLIEERYYHGCAFHPPTNSIIVDGGGYDSSSASITEVIAVDTWKTRKAGDLNQGRSEHAMVTVGGKYPTVYILGGYDRSESLLSSVEEWDPVKEEWKVAQVFLNKGRDAFAALAIQESQVC